MNDIKRSHQLSHYREIFYGIAFGATAWIIDVAMHAWTEHGSFWDELLTSKAGTVLYRSLFVVFGAVLGWVLWQKNRHERESRHLMSLLEDVRRELAGPTVVIYSKLQLLLAADNFHLSPQAEEIVRSLYQESQRLRALVNDKLAMPMQVGHSTSTRSAAYKEDPDD